jgi:hypothetical protein
MMETQKGKWLGTLFCMGFAIASGRAHVFCNEWFAQTLMDLTPPLLWHSLGRGSKSKMTDIKLPDKSSRSAKYVEAVEEEPEETELTRLNRKLRKDVSGYDHTHPWVARPRSNFAPFILWNRGWLRAWPKHSLF